MKLKGLYTVKKGNHILAKSQNQIQSDGFRLIQNWFSVTDQQKIKRVDLNDNIVQIIGVGLQSQNLNDPRQLFEGYTGNYYYTTTKNDCLRIIFKKAVETNPQQEQYQLTTKKISAIGLDIIVTPSDQQNFQSVTLKRNSNLQLRYSDSVDLQNYQQLNERSEIIIPVSVKDASFIKNDVGYQQKIFYLDKPTDMSQIKLTFNTFCDSKIQYTIYAINLYQEKEILLPPKYITLYGEGENNIIFRKQIQLSYPNSSNGYSTVFKTLIQQGQLLQQEVYAVSTDYQEGGEIKQFSYSEYQVPWSQQQLTNIQLQYQLFFTNQEYGFGDYQYQSSSSSSSNEL